MNRTGIMQTVYDIKSYRYPLPKELIAYYPAARRSHSRLMVLNRTTGRILHKRFYQIADFIEKGDALVVNDTRVKKARLYGHKEKTGGQVEILVLQHIQDNTYKALLRPKARLAAGTRIVLQKGYSAQIIDPMNGVVRFFGTQGDKIFDDIGVIPLPPYIKRASEEKDATSYQTVYSNSEGSVAAPTAGLHFTEKLLYVLLEKGVDIIPVTLYVGYSTFSPVTVKDIRQHKMAEEYYSVSERSWERIQAVKESKKRIIAVGTTATRVLESVADKNVQEGWTDLFIYPGYPFKLVDALITNFHFPESTLLMLAAAFTGLPFIKQAYQQAVEREYRFFSYGDAMFIE